METRTITQDVFLSALPREVYEAFLDSKQHAEFTGAAAEIERKGGGRFSVYGGRLSGNTLEMEQDKRIIQDWRGDRWAAGHLSRLTLTFTPIYEGKGTQISLVQTGVPAERFAEINIGWRDYYWSKLAGYLRGRKIAPVRKFLEEFKNQANIDIVDETWTEDCVLHLTGFSLPGGREAQKNIGRAIFGAFGNIHVDVNDTIVEGDRVVERHTATAVHQGEFNGIPATGRKVHWTENHIYRIADGKIAEAWSEPSFHDLMKQISSSPRSVKEA
jgi:predicted ester cyclase/uncharacterized protein YndB with AHSA1/START domain